MKRRFAVAAGLGAVAAALSGLSLHVGAANIVTLTLLPPADYPSPIGIDWVSTTNQLLISTNYSTGLPHNFESVDRGSGAHSVWSAQSGWTDEIYFVTVRHGQPGGWVEGDVFSAKGSVDTVHIAQFDANGLLINPNWGTLPGETKLKRGGLTIDRSGVPGLNGAIVVVAANDFLTPTGSTIWKVDVSGVAQKIVDLPDHAEGVAVIPNDPAYGPWAGKILVGKEASLEIEAIDPVTGTTALFNFGVSVEDIWVIPPGHDFYGVDHAEGPPPSGFGRIWTAPAAQWASAGLVGKVLLAEEHGAHLWTATWNGSTFDIVEVSGTGPIQWEHITFAPAPSVTIKKFTNGADADDPNGTGVPNIAPGGTVTWTYVVTNTGITSIPRAQVVVTDNTTGVTPTFSSEISGNGDTIFDPGEVWLYTATGTALDLTLPAPPGVHTVADSCTANGSQPPRTAYTNIGTVTVPGASASDPSSYCNPPPVPNVTIIKYTNGADANDPNGSDVPNITPGGVVTWTYKVTNTGQTSVPRPQVVVTDNTTGVTPTFSSELSGNGDTIFNPGEVWLYTATGTALDLTLPPPAGVHTVANACTANGTQPPRTAYTNVGTVTIPGANASDPSSYCNPPPTTGKSFSISGSMEGNLSNIRPGDWVSGGYSFKFVNATHAATNFSISGNVSIAVTCSQGGGAGGTIVVPLNQLPFGPAVPSIAPVVGTPTASGIVWSVPANNTNWLPSGDQNNVWTWAGSVQAPDLCGGLPMNDVNVAVFNVTVSQLPPTGSLVDFRFHYRDPAAKGKPNTNCLNTGDPNRARADVCGASWSGTKRDP